MICLYILLHPVFNSYSFFIQPRQWKKTKKWNKITRKYNWKGDFKILSEKRGFGALFSLLSRILVNKSTMKCFWQKWNLDEEDKMGLSPTQGNTSRYVRTELPDQLRMIIPFSKEIIGPAGVFVHVFTCKVQHWLLLSRGGVLYTVSFQSYQPDTKVRSFDVRTKSRTFSDLKSVCLSGLVSGSSKKLMVCRNLDFCAES